MKEDTANSNNTDDNGSAFSLNIEPTRVFDGQVRLSGVSTFR